MSVSGNPILPKPVSNDDLAAMYIAIKINDVPNTKPVSNDGLASMYIFIYIL